MVSETHFNLPQHPKFDTLSLTLLKRELFRHAFSDVTVEPGGKEINSRRICVKAAFTVALVIVSVEKEAKRLISCPHALVLQTFLDNNKNFAFKLKELVLSSIYLELFMAQNDKTSLNSRLSNLIH